MHNSTQELLDLRDSHGAGFQYGPFPHDLVATWKSGFPTGDAAAALASLLAATGWAQMGACRGRAGIAAEACAAGFGGGEGWGAEAVAERVDFEAQPDVGQDRWAVFFTAGK
jgi:hypothetical protein